MLHKHHGFEMSFTSRGSILQWIDITVNAHWVSNILIGQNPNELILYSFIRGRQPVTLGIFEIKIFNHSGTEL